MVAVIQWTEAEKAGFLPFIKEHEGNGTQWSERVALWEKEFGIPRTQGALRGRLSRCILDGSYESDKTVGPRWSSTGVTMRARGRPVTKNAVLCQPQRQPQRPPQRPFQTERILQRRSVWSVSPNREPSPALSSAPTVDASPSLPLRSPERPLLENHREKMPNFPPPAEETERLKYCSAFCKCWLDVYPQISELMQMQLQYIRP